MRAPGHFFDPSSFDERNGPAENSPIREGDAMIRASTAFVIFCLLCGATMIPASPMNHFAGENQPSYKSPLGLAVDQTGKLAVVALHSAGTAGIVDLKAGKLLAEVAVDPEPVEVALDAGSAYVRSEGRESAAVIDVAGRRVVRRSPLAKVPDRVAQTLKPWYSKKLPDIHPLPSKDIGWSRVLRDAAASLETFRIPRSHIPVTQVSQGWVFVNALHSIGPPQLTVALDEPQRGFADPVDVAATGDGELLFIACAGADTVLAVERKRLQRTLDRARSSSSGLYPDLSHDLTASRHFITAKLATQANPRRLALSGDGKVLVVSNHLADSLTVIDAAKLQVVRHIPLGGPPPDARRRGEILFHSNRMTFQGQFTCASCHPGGGSDGLNWDLERDGVGNFKNTKALWGVKDTAPYGWHGSSPTLADRVRGTLRTAHRHEPTDAEVSDLVAYLESLLLPPPLPVAEADRPRVERGKAIFEGKAQCSACHRRAGLDDGLAHDIGTRGPTDTQDRFDTPGLRGVVRTAPYLHDGRAKTLEEVFTKYNPKQWHGAAHRLSERELADVIAYLRSL